MARRRGKPGRYRFVLDHDVDVGVAHVLRHAGHDAWRAPDGLASNGEDDEMSVYAHDKDAILITRDRRFTERRKKATFGRHVRLACEAPNAVDVITARLDELLERLPAGDGVYVVKRMKVDYHPPRWDLERDPED